VFGIKVLSFGAVLDSTLADEESANFAAVDITPLAEAATPVETADIAQDAHPLVSLLLPSSFLMGVGPFGGAIGMASESFLTIFKQASIVVKACSRIDLRLEVQKRLFYIHQ
jgi:hypothetical protein